MSAAPVLPATESSASSLRREARGFLVAGAVGFAVDALLTVVFTKVLGLSPLLARLPATLVAIGVTFLLNRNWTFRSADQKPGLEFLRYLGVSAGGAIINYLLYSAFLVLGGGLGWLEPKAALTLFLAVAAGSIPALIFNFGGSRYFAFTRRASKQHTGL